MTEELPHLSDWLTEQQVTHVAMESTASYWKIQARLGVPVSVPDLGAFLEAG
jgi:hypothetical protein